MPDKEMRRYFALNNLADKGGIVIFGGSEDRDIPLCELKQSFAFDEKIYNRSFNGISVDGAIEIYDSCIAPIAPETVILHIGRADTKAFADAPDEFRRKYIELLKHIKKTNCNIVIVSLKNPENDGITAEINRQLKYIADSEKCVFGDISASRVWNPQETRDVVSFVYSIGFVRPLTCRRPIFDLIKILFCYEPLKV